MLDVGEVVEELGLEHLARCAEDRIGNRQLDTEPEQVATDGSREGTIGGQEFWRGDTDRVALQRGFDRCRARQTERIVCREVGDESARTDIGRCRVAFLGTRCLGSIDTRVERDLAKCKGEHERQHGQCRRRGAESEPHVGARGGGVRLKLV